MIAPTVISLQPGQDPSEALEYRLAEGSTYQQNVAFAPLNSRGWVLRERLLAKRQLNFAKMIAIAGLVGELKAHLDDVYLAGLCRKDLRKQLCWRAMVHGWLPWCRRLSFAG